MIMKICSRCGNRLPTGAHCPCEKRRHIEYDKYSRDRKSAGFYHSAEWLRARHLALSMSDGMDVYEYMKSGEISAADTVHHIVPLKDNWERRLDPDNLIPVSSRNHDEIHRLYGTGKEQTEAELFRMLSEFKHGGGCLSLTQGAGEKVLENQR